MCHPKITLGFGQEIEFSFQPCSHFCVPTTCRGFQDRFQRGDRIASPSVVVQTEASWSKTERRGPKLRVVVQGRGRVSAQRWLVDGSASADAARAAEARPMGAGTLLAARRVGGATLGGRRELWRCQGANACTQAHPSPAPPHLHPNSNHPSLSVAAATLKPGRAASSFDLTQLPSRRSRPLSLPRYRPALSDQERASRAGEVEACWRTYGRAVEARTVSSLALARPHLRHPH